MTIGRIATVYACCSLLTGMLIHSPAALAQTSDDDKKFLANAAQSDVNEIKISELAESKASNPQVKAFAGRMVADHTKLETKMKPFASAWGLTPPAGLDADHQAAYDKLNGLSGAEFDKEYMGAMAEDHHKALNDFKTEAEATKDARFKAAVTKGEAVVASHTTMADELKTKIN